MFDSLSNLMEPKQNLEAQPGTSSNNTNDVLIFDIEPFDFETIDDSALVDYLDQNKHKLNQMNNQTNKENTLVPVQHQTSPVVVQNDTRQKTNNYQINNVQNRQALMLA